MILNLEEEFLSNLKIAITDTSSHLKTMNFGIVYKVEKIK